MVAWVFFNWCVCRRPIWLRLALLQWPKWGCSNVQHLKTQTCVKRLEIFNERAPPPSPRWYAVLMDPRLAPCGELAAPQGLAVLCWHQGHEASRTGTVAATRDSRGPAVICTQFVCQELIQGWHHHRAVQGHQQPDSSVQGEDCRARWGPRGQHLVDTNDDKVKPLKWRLNFSRVLFFIYVISWFTMCRDQKPVAATGANCFSTFWGATTFPSPLISQKL